MSVNLINKTINDLGIDSLEIFYDFSSYSGGGFINSIESGNSSYSGEIIGDAASFTGTASGSGCFDGQYISIQNTTGITKEGFTILFSQQKTGVSPGVIYSDLDPMGPSGSEIGITASDNKLYFKNYINGTPSYITLDSIPCDKNIYAVWVDKFGYGTLARLSFGMEPETPYVYQFPNNTPSSSEKYFLMEESNFNLPPHTISNGAEWRVGSGEYSYKGYMDYFLYFNRPLGNDNARRLARSLYSDFSVTPAVTGLNRGPVTGYSEIATNVVSGITGGAKYSTGTSTQSGYYIYQSGEPQTGCVGISGIVYRPLKKIGGTPGGNLTERTLYKPLRNLAYHYEISGDPTTGHIEDWQSTGSYWHFSGNSGTYNGASATGASGTLFGITGFINHTLTGYVTGQSLDELTTSGISGALYTGFRYSPLFGSGSIYTGTGAIINQGSDINESYFPQALSVMEDTDSDYFYEVIFDASGANSISKNGEYNFYSLRNRNIAIMTGKANTHTTNLAVNGVSYFTGSQSGYKNQYNLPLLSVPTGFSVSGVRVFTNLELSETDKIIYDNIASGEKKVVEITGVDQYSAAPFTEIEIEGNQIFFNGIKLYSGINYVNNGGFYPSGNITGATGIYFTYPNYSGASSVTGSGLKPISVDHSAITPNGSILFSNGVRQDKGAIIEHARDSDLISGTRLLNKPSLIYTMSNGVEQK